MRFAETLHYATRDEQTGDVLLSTRPGARTWANFFALLRSVDVPPTSALYLLDTGTVTFIIKNRSPEIEARLAEVPPDRVCVSAVTRAELCTR